MVAFILNSTAVSAALPPTVPLLHVLRGEFDLNSPKYGCGKAQCGACRVIIDGAIAASCVVPLGQVQGTTIVTLEGLAHGAGMLHPLQQAFMDEQAAQCGYCTAGMIMAAKALLDRNLEPTDTEIRQALERNLCRCGVYHRVLKAVRRAAASMRPS